MSAFSSSVLGQVQHPKNVLREYLSAFGNKCQAEIMSWLDGWTMSKQSQGKGEESWVWLVTSRLAKDLGYCKDTVFRHLNNLLDKGVVERKDAKRWPTDTAYKYRIVPEALREFLGVEENQTARVLESDRPCTEISTPVVQNQYTILINPESNSITHTQTAEVVVEKEELQEVEAELRRLRINPATVQKYLLKFWANVPIAIARVKRGVQENWCQDSTGLFIATVKTGVDPHSDSQDSLKKEYPQPTAEERKELELRFGRHNVIETATNEPGYPRIVLVQTAEGELPWWKALPPD